ncbi:MAG: AmmeMemoRadiSam system protein A [Desulfotomaculales bacterium]
MPVVFGGICPHPPIMVPEVGGERSNEVISSRRAMQELARRLKESGAESLVMISPHAPVFRDAVAINGQPVLKGDLREFGAPQVAADLANDLALAKEIARQAEKLGIVTVELDEQFTRRYRSRLSLDHGFLVPLSFLLREGIKLPLVAISMAFLSFELLYSFGAAVKEASGQLNKKIAVLASGDLSHRLTQDAPAGFDPRGKEFDQKLADLVQKADVEAILSLDEELVERAGECGLRAIIMMLGSFDGYNPKAEVLSYEGPFGVGYLVAVLTPGELSPERAYLEKFLSRQKDDLEKRKAGESFLVRLVRRTLEKYYATGEIETPREGVPEEYLKRAAGTFVSLKKHGHLRGCIGTILPQYGSIAEEVVHNAISAATRDPRFYPVRKDELNDLTISVDVLSAPEPAEGLNDLDPKKYGVIVRSGGRSGVLLPDLEGINSAAEQVAIAMNKAGIEPGEPVELYRFTVERHS